MSEKKQSFDAPAIFQLFLRAGGVVMLVWGFAHVLSLLGILVGFHDTGRFVLSYVYSFLFWIGAGIYCLKGAPLITRIAYPSDRDSSDDSPSEVGD